MASVSGQEAEPARARGPVVGWLAKIFELKPGELNWARGIAVLDVLLVPLIVFWAIGYEQYLLSAVFGALLTGLADPGGGFGQRAGQLAAFGLIGAGVTALAFGVGKEPWGWLVLATFLVTVVCGLAVTFGVRRFVVALLLNVWFVIALGVAFSLHHHARISDYTWAQTASWAGGAALWIVVTFLWWLVGGRHDASQPLMDFPGDTSRRPLTAPVAAFAVLRAAALAGGTALAFGLDLSHGVWLPIATLIAMKPSLQQATVTALQRLAGAVIGAVVAGLLLLIPTSETGRKLFAVDHGLEVVALVLLTHGVAVRTWNYALYTAAIAAAALILVDLPQPSDYGAEGDRVLWTLCGVAIGVLTMLLAGLLAKRRGGAASSPTG